jgi:hypothetical protein
MENLLKPRTLKQILYYHTLVISHLNTYMYEYVHSSTTGGFSVVKKTIPHTKTLTEWQITYTHFTLSKGWALGSPQLQTCSANPQLCRLLKFLRLADLPDMCRFAGPFFLVFRVAICGPNSVNLQMQNCTPYKYMLEMLYFKFVSHKRTNAETRNYLMNSTLLVTVVTHLIPVKNDFRNSFITL